MWCNVKSCIATLSCAPLPTRFDSPLKWMGCWGHTKSHALRCEFGSKADKVHETFDFPFPLYPPPPLDDTAKPLPPCTFFRSLLNDSRNFGPEGEDDGRREASHYLWQACGSLLDRLPWSIAVRGQNTWKGDKMAKVCRTGDGGGAESPAHLHRAPWPAHMVVRRWKQACSFILKPMWSPDQSRASFYFIVWCKLEPRCDWWLEKWH